MVSSRQLGNTLKAKRAKSTGFTHADCCASSSICLRALPEPVIPSRPLTTAQRCRHWMKAVLQPLNEKAAKIVTEHADLLEGDSVEPLLLQLVAHVSAYRVILERYL